MCCTSAVLLFHRLIAVLPAILLPKYHCQNIIIDNAAANEHL